MSAYVIILHMQYAIFNGEKVEAQRGCVGVCPLCGNPVIAKCGEFRVHHWAHKSKVDCDNWLEKETEWHRNWKNKFPKDWREIVLYDEQTGEKHIADIRSPNGIVIEFQHSPITPQERKSREYFYKKIIWVVDGTRSKRDYDRFVKNYPRIGTSIGIHEVQDGGHYETVKRFISDFNEKVPFRQGITASELFGWDKAKVEKQIWIPHYKTEEQFVPVGACWPIGWAGSSATVVLDFGNSENGEFRNWLYVHLPKADTIQTVNREEFVNSFETYVASR